MNRLHWFRTDLRMHDNPALASHAGARSLLCVYVHTEQPPWCNERGVGAQRRRFREESLADLRRALRALGQDLLVLEGAPETLLPEVVEAYRIDAVAATHASGWYEARALAHLERVLRVPIEHFPGNTLFDAAQLPFPPRTLPPHWTPFREAVEPIAPRACVEAPATLPPPPRGVGFDWPFEAPVRPHPACQLRGGATEAARRVDAWLWRERAAAGYARTRNALDGLFASSQLSPWLADGSLSVRELAADLARFERLHGAGEGTQAFRRELLWREYFHWRERIDGVRLYAAGGIRGARARCCFDPRAFARWSAGDTPYPLVNALMRQLVATGWMGNRGRQIAASCLVNEMGTDWRFGAAFFEKHLLDHDVASNYGNWQYIAGVGCDPRGGRHFDLAKQAALHDPDGRFTRTWGGERPPQPEHAVDAADWPLEPGEAP
jgi:deoxyribodipyrimidine photo-lyase